MVDGYAIIASRDRAGLSIIWVALTGILRSYLISTVSHPILTHAFTDRLSRADVVSQEQEAVTVCYSIPVSAEPAQNVHPA